MKKIIEKIGFKDILIYIVFFWVYIIGLLLPKTGNLCLVDEFFNVFTVGIVCVYIVFKICTTPKAESFAKRILKIMVVMVCVMFFGYFAKNIVVDLVEGKQEIYLVDLEMSKYQGYSGINSLHYYMTGTDEEGNRMRLEISADDYSVLKTKDKVKVVYYKYTNRVVSYEGGTYYE